MGAPLLRRSREPRAQPPGVPSGSDVLDLVAVVFRAVAVLWQYLEIGYDHVPRMRPLPPQLSSGALQWPQQRVARDLRTHGWDGPALRAAQLWK